LFSKGVKKHFLGEKTWKGAYVRGPEKGQAAQTPQKNQEKQVKEWEKGFSGGKGSSYWEKKREKKKKEANTDGKGKKWRKPEIKCF